MSGERVAITWIRSCEPHSLFFCPILFVVCFWIADERRLMTAIASNIGTDIWLASLNKDLRFQPVKNVCIHKNQSSVSISCFLHEDLYMYVTLNWLRLFSGGNVKKKKSKNTIGFINQRIRAIVVGTYRWSIYAIVSVIIPNYRVFWDRQYRCVSVFHLIMKWTSEKV